MKTKSALWLFFVLFLLASFGSHALYAAPRDFQYEVKQLWAEGENGKIFGLIYLPRIPEAPSDAKLPTVIFSHGFGSNHLIGVPYAERLAKRGYAVYTFDFCGGGDVIKSDMEMTKMSIFTEEQDLKAVVKMIQSQPFVDKNNIFLMGGSQGGAVSAMAASDIKDDIRGLILFYPAFMIAEQNSVNPFGTVENVPDTYEIMGKTVGRVYAESLFGYDMYADVKNFDKDVLIVHGDADPVVPLSYSEKALEVYSSAKLEVLPGAGHGFRNKDVDKATNFTVKYLESQITQKPYETRELWAERDGKKIYGVIYTPFQRTKDIKKYPTVIFSHGFGNDNTSGMDYADVLARNGYAVYAFDFCGGGVTSKSDGSMLEMSIFTQKEDLKAVIDMMKAQPFVDSDNLFLMGRSQGGAVTAMAAAERKDDIKGVVMMFPAFVIADDAIKMFGSVENIPVSYDIRGKVIGRAYAEKLFDYDIYADIPAYDKDVLIIHGDADQIVPLSYAEKAVATYPSARLEVLPAAGHGFKGSDFEKSAKMALEYLNAKCN